MSNIKIAAILLCLDEHKCLARHESHSILSRKESKSVFKKTAEELIVSRFFEVIAVIGHQQFLIASIIKIV